jgi:hypothetical protein
MLWLTQCIPLFKFRLQVVITPIFTGPVKSILTEFAFFLFLSPGGLCILEPAHLQITPFPIKITKTPFLCKMLQMSSGGCTCKWEPV